MMTMLMVKWWWRQGLTRNETILPIHVWGQYPGESWWERAKRVESESLCDGNQDVWDVFLENMRLPPPWTRRSKGEKVGRRKMRNKNFGMLSRKRSSLKKKWVKISRKVKCDSQKRNCVLFCGGTWDCPRWRRRVTSPQRSRALAWVDYFINNDYDHYDHDYQTSI